MKQIKSITTYLSEYNEPPVKSEYIEYEKGELLKQSVKFDADGNVIEKTEIQYDELQRKTSETQYLSETEFAESKRFEYNADGQLCAIHSKFAEGYESKRVIEFHDELRQKIEIELDEDNELEEKHQWKYNEQGKLIEYAEYDDREKLVRKTCYEYDDKNRIVSESEFERKEKRPVSQKLYDYDTDSEKVYRIRILNHKGKLVNQYRLEYDQKNRVIKQISPISGTIEIDYVSEKERVERAIDVSGNIQNETKYVHDEHGNIVREEHPLQVKTYEVVYFD
jgi:YD repeat-containing protein